MSATRVPRVCRTSVVTLIFDEPWFWPDGLLHRLDVTFGATREPLVTGWGVCSTTSRFRRLESVRFIDLPLTIRTLALEHR